MMKDSSRVPPKSIGGIDRRQMIRGLAGSLFGLSTASGLGLMGSVAAAENGSSDDIDFLQEFALGLVEDEEKGAAWATGLDRIPAGLKEGQTLEPLCQTVIDSYPSLSNRIVAARGRDTDPRSDDPPGCPPTAVTWVFLITLYMTVTIYLDNPQGP